MCKVPEAKAARVDPEPERRPGIQEARDRMAGGEARKVSQSHMVAHTKNVHPSSTTG